MLRENELTASSIQEWCEWLDGQPRRGMTHEELDAVTYLAANEHLLNEYRSVKEIFDVSCMQQFIKKRIEEAHTYSISPTAILFLANLCDTPGIAVEYINYIQYRCWLNGVKHVDWKSCRA